jgi:hypothetical protein
MIDASQAGILADVTKLIAVLIWPATLLICVMI